MKEIASKLVNVDTPESAYVLGLLWADGYVSKTSISLETNQTDCETFKTIFNKLGNWHCYTRHRPERQPQMSLVYCDIELASYLEHFYYRAKSNASADKILKTIPKSFVHYWFRGLIDGDGCFYQEPTGYHPELSVCSSHNQDWQYLGQICDKLGVGFGIQKRRHKTGKFSTFRIRRRSDIRTFGEFIYHGFPADKIGLIRKFDKYSTIINPHKP